MKQRNVLLGLALACLTSLSTLVPQKTQAIEWLWGSVRAQVGITVCEGWPDNCTKSVKEVEDVAP